MLGKLEDLIRSRRWDVLHDGDQSSCFLLWFTVNIEDMEICFDRGFKKRLGWSWKDAPSGMRTSRNRLIGSERSWKELLSGPSSAAPHLPTWALTGGKQIPEYGWPHSAHLVAVVTGVKEGHPGGAEVVWAVLRWRLQLDRRCCDFNLIGEMFLFSSCRNARINSSCY